MCNGFVLREPDKVKRGKDVTVPRKHVRSINGSHKESPIQSSRH